MTWCGNTSPEHRVHRCTPCQSEYRRQLRAGRLAAKPKQMPFPSPLNRRVTAKYEKCAGNHVRSKVWLNREWKGIWSSFNVCAACLVPIKHGRVLSVWLSGEEAA